MTSPLPKLALVLSFAAAGVALASEPSEILIKQALELPSEQSEILSTRGLVLFHEARYDEALALFTRAVEADREDAYALYYKGVTEGRLHKWDEAVSDLRTAMRIKPDLTQGALELGVALVNTGELDEAEKWLAQAQQVPDLDATASFYLGIAQLDGGKLSTARLNFERAAAGATVDPEFRATCQYYQGVVERGMGNQERAKVLFEQVIAANPDSEIGREARAFLVGVQEGGWPTLRRYQLYAGTGFEYDSNVVLAPLNDEAAAGFGKQSDGRAILLAGGSYTIWRAEHAQLSAGYDFFQSLHFDLTQFNMQDHHLTLSLAGAMGLVQGGVVGAYDYYLRDTNSFLQQGEALPWLRISEPAFGRTEVFFRVRRRDFKEIAFQNALDSFTYMTGFDQFVNLGAPDRYVVAGYRFDTMVPTDGAAEVFAYDGNQVRAGLGGTLPFEIAAELDYAYRNKDYAPASGGRDDNEHRVLLFTQKQVADYTFLTLAYFGTFNQSNQPVFEYNRQIVSLSLQVRY